MEPVPQDTLFPRGRVPIGWTLLFLVFVASIFNFPLFPSSDLDSSWRIALGYFFQEGAQFGRDVVFTYGPLGFAMGKTYSGLQFTAIVVAQLAFALIGASVVLREGHRMQGLSRWSYFVGLLLFSTTYEDAAHMVFIVLMGFQLLRSEGGRREAIILAALLAVFASAKFTDLMLAGLMVGIVCAHSAWRKRWKEVLLVGGIFTGAFLAIWVACGQNPLNLAAYFRGSWSISQGYTEAMGFPSPWPPLWKALVVLGMIASYLLGHLWLNADKPRAVANGLMLAGFIFMNWKHGFVRADGHMIGFFFCALLPLTAYPTLLGDAARFRRLHYAVFTAGILLCLWGIENALYGVTRGSAGIVQERIWRNIEATLNPADTRMRYETSLLKARTATDLAQTRKIVGQSAIDVLGYEQAVAIFNNLNYRPRPVIQSYSVFTSYLAKLNRDFYESENAPEFLLIKVQSIDYRLPTMDDPEIWRVVPHRYDFVLNERGFQLWRKRPSKLDDKAIEPKLLTTKSIAIGQTLSLEEYASRQLWVRIDLKQTLFGRLHSFLYKPPHVTLVLTDAHGNEAAFFMPLPQGRAGFIVSPMVEDAMGFATFAAGRPGREARQLRLKIKSHDLFLFEDQAVVDISELIPALTAKRFFNIETEQLFHMFKTVPVQFESQVPHSEATIEDHQVIVMHAPSQMTFDIPRGAKTVSGFFGYLPGAYSNTGNTDGAEFTIYWSDGANRVDLFKKRLDPGRNESDRRAQQFTASFDGLSGGRLYLNISAGPTGNYAWDWTWWSGIEVK